METLSSKNKRNNNTPELIDGRATERQITAERSVIFTHVLTGLGVSRQVQRFIWAIYTVAKPGEYFQFNDYQLAEYLGCAAGPTTRNYVSNLRRKMRDWNNGSYNAHGLKHFAFVSVQENSYDPKTKKQNPTGYLFSEKFADLLDELGRKVREHGSYQKNWILAIRQVCGDVSRSELSEFGFWNERKEKRPRLVEDILGTLLLNYKRLTRKIIDTSVEFGFSKSETAELLIKLSTGYIKQAEFTSLASGPVATIKGPQGDPEADVLDGFAPYGDGKKVNFVKIKAERKDFDAVWNKVFAYVSEREYPTETGNEFKKYYQSKNGGLTNDRNMARQTVINGTGRNGSDITAVRSGSYGLGSRNDIRILPTEQTDGFMDQQRERFLQRIKTRQSDL